MIKFIMFRAKDRAPWTTSDTPSRSTLWLNPCQTHSSRHVVPGLLVGRHDGDFWQPHFYQILILLSGNARAATRHRRRKTRSLARETRLYLLIRVCRGPPGGGWWARPPRWVPPHKPVFFTPSAPHVALPCSILVHPTSYVPGLISGPELFI